MGRHLKAIIFVVTLGLSGVAQAVHIVLQSVNTEAEVRDPLTTPVIEVDFSAELQGVPPDPVEPVGVLYAQDCRPTQAGFCVEPTLALEISIPSGCLASDSMARCVLGRLVADGASTPLTILTFDARFFARDDGTMRFDMTASFLGGDEASSILSTLGGRAVELTIGAESATALTTGIEAVAGIEPEPFIPPPDDG